LGNGDHAISEKMLSIEQYHHFKFYSRQSYIEDSSWYSFRSTFM